MKAKAVFLRKLSDFRGVAKLYQLDPPMKDYDDKEHEFVIVSAAIAPYSGPETYVFPADANGNIISWGEMPASQRGTLSHKLVLTEAGYMIDEEKPDA